MQDRFPVVLVIDDHALDRMVARKAIELGDYLVVEAENGEVGLKMFKELNPDLVLLDIKMPKVDGFTTCKAIRQLPKGAHTPIIMMTGLDDADSISRAYEQGATDFITKPINPMILVHRLRYVLRATQIADQFRRSEGRLSNAQRIAKLGHWEWDAEARFVTFYDASGDFFGLPEAETRITLQEFIGYVFPDDRTAVKRAFVHGIRSGKNFSLEHRLVGPDGTERIVCQEVEVNKHAGSNHAEISGIVQDVTERRYAEEQIRYLTYFDSLTGLPNRRFLQPHLRQAISSVKRYGGSVAVVVVDIDHFKRFNDSLGQGIGDHLLQVTADRLRNCIRDSDYIARNTLAVGRTDSQSRHVHAVARLDGDEFVVVLTQIRNAEDAAVVIRRISEKLSDPFIVKSDELYITASIGISVCPTDGDDADALLKNASIAMTNAKESGGNQSQFFTRSINLLAQKRFSIETRLRKALKKDRLSLHYQPRMELPSNDVIGAEALVRCDEPDLGRIPPIELIPIAEDMGIMNSLSEWVLGTACDQCKIWHNLGMTDLAVSVNVSASQLKRKDFGKLIVDVLAASGIAPGELELEITEGVLMQNAEERVCALSELKEIGVKVSIDDFGTGYSSLSYLSRFPLTAIKIDQSFIRELVHSPNNAAITSAIITLGHSLKLRVVAEGVEQADQLDFLRDHQCDEVQGHLISPAVPAPQFTEWVGMRTQRSLS
ncbi:MAG: EAL domain-containing protein [Gammaproteobacteria bacterium]|nr:EAL domain-containing protein [Gammaproteobacteria bacterium]